MRINPPTQWKPLLPFKPNLCLIGVTTAQQILGIKAQEYEGPFDQIQNGIILFGLLAGLFLILGTFWCIARCCHRRCVRATEAAEPEGEPEEDDEILPQEVQQGDEIPVVEHQPDENPNEYGEE